MKLNFKFLLSRVVLSAALLLFAALAIYGFGRFFLLELAVQSLVIPFAERNVPGLALSITSVSSDLLSTIQFKNLALRYRLEDGTVFEAELPRVKLDFSLADLRDNYRTLIGNARITAELKAAGINLVRAAAEAAPAWQISLPAIPVPLPAIDLRYENLLITHPDARLTLRAGELTLAPTAGGARPGAVLSMGLRAGRIDLQAGNFQESVGELRADGFYRPGALEVTRLTVAGAEFARNFLLNSEAGKVSLQAALTLWGGRFDLQAEMDEEVIRAGFVASGLNLKAITPPLPAVGIPSTGLLEARGELTFPVAEPLRMAGRLNLALDRTTLRALPVEMLELRARVGNGLLHIDELHAKARQNQVDFEDVELPLAPLFSGKWAELAGRSRGVFSLALDRLVTEADLLPETAKAFIERNGMALLRIEGKYTDGLVAVPQFTVHSVNDLFIGKELFVDLNPWLREHDWQAITLKGALQIESRGADFVEEFGLDLPLDGKLSATLAVAGTLGSPAVSFKVVGEQGKISFAEFDAITVLGRYQAQEFILETIQASNGADTLQGDYRYQTAKPHAYRGQLELKLMDLSDYLTPSMRQQYQVKGDLAGRYGFSSDGEILSADCLFESGALWYMDQKAEQVKIKARLSGDELAISSFQGQFPAQEVLLSLAADLSFNPEWDQIQVDLKDLALTHGARTFTLLPPARLRYEAGQTQLVTPLNFQEESLRFSLAGRLGAEKVDLRLSGEITDGERFFESFGLSDFSFQEASFLAAISGDLLAPQLDFSGKISQMSAGAAAPPLDGSFSCSFGGQQLRIDHLLVSDSGSPRLRLHGQLPLAIKERRLELPAGQLQLQGEIDLQSSPLLPWLLQKEFDRIGAVRGKIELGGTWQQPSGAVQLAVTDMLLKDRSGWLPAEPLDLRLEIIAGKEKIILRQALINSTSLSLQLHGSAVGEDFLGKYLRPGGQERFGQTEIDLRGALVLKQIDWLAGRHQLLRRTSGQVESDFQVSGSVAAPHLQAAISIAEAEVRLSNDLPALQNANLQAQVADSVIEITSFTGNLGGAPLEGQGKITLPGPAGLTGLDLTLAGNDLLFYRAEGLNFRGDARLRIQGSVERPRVSGDLILTDASVTRKIDFVSSLLSGFAAREAPPPRFPAFTEPPLRDTLLNLKLTAREPIFLANNILRGKVMPQLELHGSGEVPFLAGTLFINEANLMLPAGKVKMDSGLVQFLETDPDRPVLELSGTAQMLGYEIVVGISGPYDAPVIVLSSTPALPNEDLLMLLLAGKRPLTGRNQPDQGQNYSSVAVYLGENLLKSLWNKEDDGDPNLLDRLQLEIGKNITQQGEETIEAQFLVAENINNGQNAVLLTGEKDVWGKYNGGLRLVFKFK